MLLSQNTPAHYLRIRSPTGGAVVRLSRGSRVIRRQAIHRPEQEVAARHKLSEASKDIRPYILWDRVVRLTASWDARAQSQADLKGVCEVLEQLALDRITVAKAGDAAGQPLTTLTVVCKPDDSDEVAAALLKWTPATHVTSLPSEHCYLPQHVLAVDTPFGSIDVGLSLAGSSVCKVTPNWEQCQKAAAAAASAAGQGVQQAGGKGADGSSSSGSIGVDAADVAAAALESLNVGLADGSVQLDAHRIF